MENINIGVYGIKFTLVGLALGMIGFVNTLMLSLIKNPEHKIIATWFLIVYGIISVITLLWSAWRLDR